METNTVTQSKQKIIPAQQIGYVCASLQSHIEDSKRSGHELRKNGQGFEIWQPKQIVILKQSN